MEKELSFPAHDGKTIYAALNTTVKKCRGLIIYAHGLPCGRNDHTYLQSARMFTKLGYDTLRISFYDWQKNARCLTDCTIETHADDLETAIHRYTRKYQKIYLIGHSWGGLTIMNTNRTGVAAISLWDPSYNSAAWWQDFSRIEKGNVILKDATEYFISKDMHEYALSCNLNTCRMLSAQNTKPVQVLHAKKNGILYKFKESYHTYSKGPIDYHLIKEADHSFLAEDALKYAVTLTHQWFKKF